MNIAIGDHVVVEGTRPGATRREGEITALHHQDGSPPYDVTWQETGQTTVYCPGVDGRIEHDAHAGHQGHGMADRGGS